MKSDSSRLRIAVAGATGQVGYELVRELAPLGDVIALSRPHFDLDRPAEARALIRAIAPDIIVNAAAFTDVDSAESQVEACFRVNAEGPAMLADEARRLGAVLVHYSTGYVFDGQSARPYSEADVATPLSVYGSSKLAGEQAIQQSDVPHIILRTGWVYGLRGRNFLQTVRRLAAEEDDLPIVSDQFGSPTWCRLIASGTAAIIARLGTGRDEVVASARRRGGLYHMMAAGSASWHDFATSIVAATPHGRTTAVVRAIPAAEYPSAARRPNNSLLDCSRLASTFGVVLPDWRVQFALASGAAQSTMGATGVRA